MTEPERVKIEQCKPGDAVVFLGIARIVDGMEIRRAPSSRGRLMCFIGGAPFVRFELPGGSYTDILQVEQGQLVTVERNYA